ncbi:MAG: PAS domain S-box protein [Methanobacteriaceae archaeon]|nr:PAS domain S-box protein [Methanobacteriaceae archaeon]
MSKVKILLMGAELESAIQLKLEEWGYQIIDNISIDKFSPRKMDNIIPDLILIYNLSETDCYKIENLQTDLTKYNIPILFLSPNVSKNSLKKIETLDNYYYLEHLNEDAIKFALKNIISKSKKDQKSSVRLKEITNVLSRLTSDPELNIRNITILCGKLLNAHCALYRSLKGEKLYTLAHWNLPPNFKKVEKAKGHLCLDLIKSNDDDIFLVNNLPETIYYETDPNVKAFNLKTYAGYPVQFAGKTMGLLCVVYQEDYLLDEDEKEVLKILASTIGEEEERKITISNLKQSDELFQSLWEKNLDATLILDWDGKILFANPAAAKLGGIKSPEDAIGKNILNYVDEITQKRIIKHIDLVKKDKGGFLAEYKIKTPSGENKFVEGLGTKIQFRGKPANIVTVRDITPRKKAEKEIEKSESFYRSIFENTGTATVLVDEKNVISLANSEFEKLSGYSRNEIEGKLKWTQFVHENYKDKMVEYHKLKRNWKDKTPKKFEFKFIDRENNVKDILLTVDLIKGTKISVASLIDITEKKKAVKALKESYELYETLVRTSPEAITLTDLKGDISYVSQRKLEMFGYKDEKELIGRNVLDLVRLGENDQKHAYVRKLRNQLLEKGIIRNKIFEAKNKDGNYFTIEISASLFKDAHNKPKGIIITSHDITNRRKMEKQLKKREELLTLVTDNMLNIVGQLDSKLKFKYISPSVKQILGYSVEDVIGTSVFEFLEKVHPDDFEKVKNTFLEATMSYKPGDVKHRYKHADGHYIWLESLGNPLFDKENNFLGVVFSLTDITDIKNVELELRESEEKYKTLFASSPDYIIVIGIDGQILAMNNILSMELSRYVKDINTVKNVTDLGYLSKKHYSLMDTVKKQIINGENIEPMELLVEGLDHEKHWIEVRTIPMKKDEELNALTVIVRDITERKLYDEAIKKSLIEKDHLLKEIHHRVKNNLQIISSLLNLQSTFIEDEDAFDVFQESLNRVKSMAMIHEQLYQSKDLSRINFSDYIHSLVSGLLSSYTVDPEHIKVKIDAKDIYMDINTAVPCGLIINELITNSLKHAFPMGLKGEISIKLEKDEKYILEVSDTGIGMDEGFDIKKSNTLGFLLINSLIKQLDGTIKLDQSSGTRFVITFSKLIYQKRI